MPYLVVSSAYLLSSLWLAWSGFPFAFSLDWMWLPDAADLRDRLAETLWYFHAFPPGMDLLTGILLKLAGGGAGNLARVVFWSFGLGLANLLVTLGLALGLGARAAVAVALAFMLSPPALFLGHLYHYEWVDVTLLVGSAVAFHRACLSPSRGRWTVFFLVCAALAVTRSTFHLVWLVALTAAAIAVSGRSKWRLALAGALPALVIVVAVYGKNALVFGEFAASTFGPASMHLVTVDRLPDEERRRWMAAGRLSPFADISAYAPPRAYAGFFGPSDLAGWPPQVDRLEHVSVRAPNYNHWFLLEVHRARARDVSVYLRERPLAYLGNVWSGFVALLGPTTEWHPRTGTPASPHAGHRALLGGYEAAYNRIVHGLAFAPAGVYVLLPAVLAVSLWRARRLWLSGTPAGRARGAVTAYAVFQIVFVIAVSSLATYLESSRYRFQIEPFIWLVTVATAASVVRRRG